MKPSAPPPPAADFEFEALQRAANYRRALAREFAPYLRGRVLEAGAGIGQFTAELARVPSVESLVCVEPEPGFHATFRQTHPRHQLIEGTVEAVPADLVVDAIVSVNVLEHIAEDDAELGRYAARLAAREGHLCLFVPARRELYAAIDRDFGHHRRYVRPELKDKLDRAGFNVVRLHYFNCAGYFGWWLMFRVLKRRRFDPASVASFDRFIFPLVHGFERAVLRPPFGQSLLAVAQVRARRH